MHPSCRSSEERAGYGEHTAVGKDGVCAEDDFVDSRHDGVYRRVGNKEGGYAGGGEITGHVVTAVSVSRQNIFSMRRG